MFKVETKKDGVTVLLTKLNALAESCEKDSLKNYGDMAVNSLRETTPKRTGRTSESWYYSIENENNGRALRLYNSNVQNGTHVATAILYGHGTKSGKYVPGVDYVTPAMESVYKKIEEDISKELGKI